MNEPEEQEGLGEVLMRLIDDVKGVGRAELGYYYAVARGKLHELSLAIWAGFAAGALVIAAAVALVLGAVITLAPRVGPGWATLIVVAVALLLAGITARLAWVRIKRVLKEWK